ncbi:TlpA family protein disulfide reductase [Planctomycetota bacterium]|nr:TlpA family protein disulfide reductase [Planctomycetota bacterium]
MKHIFSLVLVMLVAIGLCGDVVWGQSGKKMVQVMTGEVVDEETGEKLSGIEVFAGISYSDKACYYWDFEGSNYKINVKGHKFQVRNELLYYPYTAFRVYKEGYEPGVTRFVGASEKAVKLRVELKKAAGGMNGVVVDAWGMRVEGARVMPVVKGARVRFDGPVYRRRLPMVESGEKGEFEVVDQKSEFGMLVLHERGYAVISLEEMAKRLKGNDVGESAEEKWEAGDIGVVRLAGWGELRGEVWMDGELLKGAMISLEPETNYDVYDVRTEQTTAIVYEMCTGRSDEDGKYEFKYVPMGKLRVEVMDDSKSMDEGIKTLYEMEAEVDWMVGKLDLSNEGLYVKGCVEVKGLEAGWKIDYARMEMVVEEDDSFLPEGWEEMDRYEQGEWLEEFGKTDEYVALIEKASEKAQAAKSYAFEVQERGNFVIRNVEPGEYRLLILYGKEGVGEEAGYRIDTKVVVKDEGEKVVDVGNFVAMKVDRLEVGDDAPDFEVFELMDKEKVLRLHDYRGKWVLLDFWATWCSSCVVQTPFIKEAWERYGEQGNWEIVMLTLDRGREPAVEYVRKHGLDFDQGFLGPWDEEMDVMKAYGVQGIPTLILVSPEGKIVAKGFDRKEILEVVREHVAE